MSKKLIMNNCSENELTPVMDGLVCWLDGRDLENAEENTVWLDKSGNNNHAVLKLRGTNKSSLENDYYRTNGSGYVKLPDLSFDLQNGGISIYISSIMHESIKHQYARIFTLGTNASAITQLALLNGTSNTGSIRCFNLMSNKLFKNYEIDKSIQVGIIYDGQTLKATDYIDNNKIEQEIAENRVEKFTSNYLNGESANVINTHDMSYGLVLIYNRALTEEEMNQNYLYEQSINRGE